MGKCVRLRDREKGRDVARDSRARKNIFWRSVKGDGEREMITGSRDSTKGPLDRRQSKHH